MGFFDLFKKKKEEPVVNAEANSEEITTTLSEGENEGATEGEGSKTDVEITDGETSLVKVDLQYIDKTAAESIVSTFGYDVEILGLDLYEKRVWVRGDVDEVNDAVANVKVDLATAGAAVKQEIANVGYKTLKMLYTEEELLSMFSEFLKEKKLIYKNY